MHDYFGNALSQKYLDELIAFRPCERVRGYTGPVLIVHGDADESILLGDSEEYERALGAGSNVDVHVIEGADHNYSGLRWEGKLVDITAAFLKRHFEVSPR